ncbi:glycosyl transferase family 90 protein [Nitzschia inconspicua]|uniref:Glycosyl transferase family 90 protein n=1 Tax=Nitzschia inconspicua TaxID=303405 RepID=A0A9K3LHI3_9STRA|nr:glycosyl transferase family 90 protein [Nitzschia inconspicua]
MSVVKQVPSVLLCIAILGTVMLGSTVHYGAIVQRFYFSNGIQDTIVHEEIPVKAISLPQSEQNIVTSLRASRPRTAPSKLTTTDEFLKDFELGIDKFRGLMDENFSLIDSHSLEKISFQFPSVEQRVRYYMGSWYTPTTKYNITALCEEVPPFPLHGLPPGQHHTKPFLFDKNNVDAFPTAEYIPDVKHYIIEHASNQSSFQAVLALGDTQNGGNRWPAIIKSRRLYNFKKKSILAMLKEERHYKMIDVVTNTNEIPWKDKKDVLIWRGSTTGRPWEPGSRLNVVKNYYNAINEGIDVAFSKLIWGSHYSNSTEAEDFTRERINEVDLMQYKYLLSIEGNDVATGLKWMLYSNSLVFMAPPRYETWAMEGLLVPYYHYIPVAPDYHDLREKLEWARKNDEACQRISKQATQFMKDLYVSEQAKKDSFEIHHQIVQRYERFYTKELNKCRIVT